MITEDGTPAEDIVTTLGFRRRCAWCGVQLRGWQLNLCKLCGPRAKGSAGIYLSAGGPPCSQGARWDEKPDDWGRRRRR
jgi:hypothetical protein